MTRVEGTNDFSIVSKLSSSTFGYWPDSFLQEFVEKPRRRASLIHWGYYLRQKSLQLTFEKAVEQLAGCAGPFQVLSIGAGFDTTFFNVAEKYLREEDRFFEVDLPDNVKRKTRLIQNSTKCLEVLKEPVSFENNEISCSNFELFACDLAQQDKLEKRLIKARFNFDLPTVIISECVITYMDEKDSTSLIRFLARKLKNSVFVVYEQIRPGDGFGRFMVEHFEKMESPIKGVHVFPTRQDQIQRYLRNGWSKVQAYPLTNVYRSLPSHEKIRILNIEPFDEFEEFILKAAHYVVICSAKGDCIDVLDSFDIIRVEEQDNMRMIKLQLNSRGFREERFGHGVYSWGSTVCVIGGFGPVLGQQKRINSVMKTDLTDVEHTKASVSDPVFERMYCSVSGSGEWAYITGGRKSPKHGLSDIVKLNVRNLTWEVLRTSLEEERWRHVTGMLGEWLVVVGGRGAEGVLKDVSALNVRTGVWAESGELTVGAHSCSGAVWMDKLLVTGGMDEVGRLVEGVVEVEIVEDEEKVDWKVVVTNRAVRGLKGRFGHTSHVLGDRLVLVGGVGMEEAPGVTIVDLITDEVEGEAGIEEGRDIIMLHGHGSVENGGTVVVVGGGGNCFSFGTHYNKQLVEIDLKTNFDSIGQMFETYMHVP